jgi:hypothetical protein
MQLLRVGLAKRSQTPEHPEDILARLPPRQIALVIGLQYYVRLNSPQIGMIEGDG